jgi:hypothetical protein
MINAEFVRKWSSGYPVQYDQNHYDPHIVQARNGDKEALRKLTEWKNVGAGPRPMRLSRNKEKAFEKLLNNITHYLGNGGQGKLRTDFSRNAPVLAIFWHHVLFQTPIFDVYTHMAYHWDKAGTILCKSDAKIKAPDHWEIYDQYRAWFEGVLRRVQVEDNSISERQLDRAFFCWGEAEVKKQRTIKSSGRRIRRR